MIENSTMYKIERCATVWFWLVLVGILVIDVCKVQGSNSIYNQVCRGKYLGFMQWCM